MNRGLNIGIEIAGRGDRARGLAWGNATLLQVSPRIGGVTEGDSRHACAEASISTFDELRLFNRDRPAVAADQARRGEGGGEDRQVVVLGKSMSVLLILVGLVIIKNKKF